MRNIKLAFFCAGTNFLKWHKNLTVLMAALVWGVLTVYYTKGLTEFCIAEGHYISPWVLPFYLDSPYGVFLYVAVLIILFAHAPFCDVATPFALIRTGKCTWFMGQVLYIVGASFLTVAYTYGCILVTLLPCLGYTNEWGGVLIGLTEDPSLIAGYTEGIRPNAYIVQSYSAIEATVITFLLIWLTSVFVGCIILFFNTVVASGAGVYVATLLACWTYFTELGSMLFYRGVQSTAIFMWCSLKWLYPINTDALSVNTAVGIQLAFIAVSVIASTAAFCKRDTQFEKGMS